jgi:hypothetical protein
MVDQYAAHYLRCHGKKVRTVLPIPIFLVDQK